MSNTMSGCQEVLLVGQLYMDTILYVDGFPEEDCKVRANHAEQRTGGNTCNTAQVLAQFHHLNVCYMSAAGSHETSSHIEDMLKAKNIQHLEILYRDNATIPSSIIIHNEKTGSRTIISNNDVQDITRDEFITIFSRINTSNKWWVHYEGRNISEAVKQIDWLHEKAIKESWRDQLVISVEVEKPARPDIESLISRGDVVFFSKIFAEHHGFYDTMSFLTNYDLLNDLKPKAKAFCTWGSKGASVLDNATKETFHAVPPTINQVVDSTGAGDTFIAGVISSLLSNKSLQEALESACYLASKKVSQLGFGNLVA